MKNTVLDSRALAGAEKEFISASPSPESPSENVEANYSLMMMRTASRAGADRAEEILGGVFGAKIYIFCGGGKNGGDGFGAALFLLERRADVRCVPVGGLDNMAWETRYYHDRFIAAGGSVATFGSESDNTALPGLAGADLIIDALFGIGFHGELSGVYRLAADIINTASAPVLSLDIPSGAEGSSALVSDGCVRADHTIAFTSLKPAHCIQPAKSFCGEITVADVGLPQSYTAAIPNAQKSRLITRDTAAALLPTRRNDSHKGDYGKVLVIGGSTGYTGAPRLSAYAAFRAGSGLVYLAAPEDIYPVQAAACLEVICMPFAGREGGFALSALDSLLELMNRCDVCVLGPGLGRSSDSDNLAVQLIMSAEKPVVIDADGINALSTNINGSGGEKILKRIRDVGSRIVLTPHDVEFSRLADSLGTGIDAGRQGRLPAARALSEALGCTVVLKGNTTVVASPGRQADINTTGNPGMAKGGSGDVLSGVIASLMGQGLDIHSASAAGVYLHGLAGDLAAAKLGMHGMLPSDLLEMLPYAIKDTLEGNLH